MGDPVAYDVFVGLHVTSAVVGFGSVALSGVYGGSARHIERDTTAEEVRRYFRAPGRLEFALLAVPVFGAAAIGVGPGGHGFAQLWVGLGFGLWVVASALLLGVVRRSGAVLRRASLAGETAHGSDPHLLDTADERLRAAGRRLQWAAAACDLIFLVALVIMVTKPGS